MQAHCLILTLVTRALCRRIFTSRITRFHREGFIIYNKTEAQIFFLELILNVVYEIRKKGGRERSFGSIIDEQTRGKGYLLLHDKRMLEILRNINLFLCSIVS